MSRDPEGKAALFGPSPVGSSSGDAGHDAALEVTGEGPVLITCSECGTGTRVSYRELGGRLVRLSLWNPQREHAHWMRCPACDRRNWCRVTL